MLSLVANYGIKLFRYSNIVKEYARPKQGFWLFMQNNNMVKE